jgi:intron-binding protein aquarius
VLLLPPVVWRVVSQFLTFHDYLLRSFTLFRLESAYEVREDVCDVVHRLKPKVVADYDSGARRERTEFGGWARMAVEVRRWACDGLLCTRERCGSLTGAAWRSLDVWRLQVSDFRVEFVAKPKLGFDAPAEVRAEVEFTLGRVAQHIRSEWDSLREHDVIFLLQVSEASGTAASAWEPSKAPPTSERGAFIRRDACG